MSRRAASRLGQLLFCVFGIAAMSMLPACFSRSSSVTYGTTSSGEEAGDGEAPEAVDGVAPVVSLFTARDDTRALTGGATLDPGNLSSLAGRGVLFFDRASESIILLELDGTPSLFTHRDDLLAATNRGSVELGRMDQVEGGPFDGQTLCADSVSGLVLRIGVDGTPHVHATDAQILAATEESDARLHLPRALASDQIIAQDLESKHILSFGIGGRAEILVEDADLAAAAGVPEDAAEISSWARGPLGGDQYASFGSTNTIVRIGPGGLVDRHVQPEVLQAVFPEFNNPAIARLATDEEGSDELYILVSDDGPGKGIAVASPDGAVRQFTDFNEFTDTIGVAGIFDLGFLTLDDDRFFYVMDGIGEAVFILDAEGTPEEVSGPGDLIGATGARRVSLGPGAPIDDLGLVVLEPESDSFVLLRRWGPLARTRPRQPAGPYRPVRS